MEEFLRFVISQLLAHPEEAVLAKTESPDKITYHLAMNKTDIPRLIGRSGHTIQSIRSLLDAAAHKRGLRVSLEIVE